MESYGWRTVIINNNARLSFCQGNLVVSTDSGIDRIPVDQIRNLMINSEQTTLTSKLIYEMNLNNIKVIFCDNKHLPSCELCGYNNNIVTAGKHQEQAAWDEKIKNAVWVKIIKAKILSQYNMLRINNIENAEILLEFAENVSETNAVVQEALAARYYFSMLFGNDFTRRTMSNINSALNYGYSLILSSVSRAIVLHGYLTSIGINHCSQRNSFNFSCDIMEPFRPFVDNYVYKQQDRELNWSYKQDLINLSLETVVYKGHKMELQTAIDIFVNDVLTELSQNTSKIKEIEFYEQS